MTLLWSTMVAGISLARDPQAHARKRACCSANARFLTDVNVAQNTLAFNNSIPLAEMPDMRCKSRDAICLGETGVKVLIA